jgi:hypothetical protein
MIGATRGSDLSANFGPLTGVLGTSVLSVGESSLEKSARARVFVCGKLIQQTVATPWINTVRKKKVSFYMCRNVDFLLSQSIVIVRNTVK